MKVDFGWVASIFAAIYLLVTTGFWPLTVVGVPGIVLGLWVTSRPETSTDRHTIVQMACFLAIMTALGMQGVLTL
jgi:phosphotransferase system  glucose/maltose/N-acetylglucosamine-specific IIC component